VSDVDPPFDQKMATGRNGSTAAVLTSAVGMTKFRAKAARISDGDFLGTRARAGGKPRFDERFQRLIVDLLRFEVADM
jgi:hypothetical protein